MRICFLIASLETGGAERVLSHLANLMTQEGHTVHILTFRPPEHPPAYALETGVRVLGLGYLLRGSTIRLPFRFFKQLITLRRTVQDLKPDVVVSFVDQMNLVSLVALRGTGLPLVISERTDPKHHSIGLLRKWLYPWANALVVQRPEIAEQFKYLGSKVVTLANPVFLPRASKEWSQRTNIILSLGRLSPEKNFDLLIRAFAPLAQTYPSWQLRICGEGPERGSLERLISELGLEKKISLPGHNPTPLSDLLKVDLFAFPSRFEGFPNALAEAMAVGLSVITSPHEGCRALVTHEKTGYVLKDYTTPSLTHALEFLMTHPDQAQQMGQRARKAIKLYDPQKICAQWITLFKRLRE